MKRVILATALAAAGLISAVPAGAAPLGTQNACVVANSAAVSASSSCRFIGGSSIGVLGFTDTGWEVTYTARRVKSTGPGGCAAAYENVPVVVEDWSFGQSIPGSQTSFAPAGRVYTLTVFGNGEAQAGGQGATPSASEPADVPVDETNGVPAC